MFCLDSGVAWNTNSDAEGFVLAMPNIFVAIAPTAGAVGTANLALNKPPIGPSQTTRRWPPAARRRIEEKVGLPVKPRTMGRMSLRSQLDALASSFASAVVDAIRGASLQELGGAGAAGNGRSSRVAPPEGGGQPDSLSAPKKRGKNGRLPRRSADEIAKALDKIVLLVKTQKAGMRAEEIRSKLGMESKEMPRILKEGLAKKKLTAKGNKRATTYFTK